MRLGSFIAASFGVVLSLVGCTRSETSVSSTQPTTSNVTTYNLTILGDATRLAILQRLADENKTRPETSDGCVYITYHTDGRRVQVSAAQNDDVVTKAKLAASADVAILAMDATNGPLPVHREDVLLARQMYVSKLNILLTRTERIDDPELLDLEELESRELLNKYRMDGDHTLCLVDSVRGLKGRKLQSVKDFSEIKEIVRLLAKRAHSGGSVPSDLVTTSFYVLTNQELFLRGVNNPPQTGPYVILVGTEQVDGLVTFPKNVDFGENIDGSIRFTKLTNVYPGQRLVVLRDGHIAAAGVITSASRK